MKISVPLILFFLISVNVLFASTVNNSDIILINSLKSYENDSHSKFQDELYQFSEQYIKDQSEKFVDNETGFLKLWGEFFRFFESDTKRNARWKNRVEKYFRTTGYIQYIQQKHAIYAENINLQRQELLGKLHSKGEELSIINENISTLKVSDKEMSKVVDNVNKLVLTEVIPEILETIVFPLSFSLLGMVFGIVLAKSTKGILFIIGLLIAIWQSFRYSDKLEQQVIESFVVNEQKHLEILPQLNKNTADYYKQLNNKIK